MVSKGEVVEVRKLIGVVGEEIAASINGMIIIQMTHVRVNSGDLVMILGELER